MKRVLFLVSLAATTIALTSLRVANARSRRSSRGPIAGQCANNHGRGRWSAYTSADFS